MKVILLVGLLLVSAWTFEVKATACTNIPADHVYYLTSFCDKTTACGKSCGNCNWFYAADSQRFKCGSTISCSRAGKSANLEVIDYGPDCELEKKSGKPIIDASYSTCKLFTGSTSCGWSDKFAVTCVKVGLLESALGIHKTETSPSVTSKNIEANMDSTTFMSGSKRWRK